MVRPPAAWQKIIKDILHRLTLLPAGFPDGFDRELAFFQ
jgi:hypothetical protein